MKRTISLAMVMALGLAMGGCGLSKATRPDVHVQLNDGQVLVGKLTTPTFALKTGFGTLQFNTDDAGELGPLEGKDMKQSDNLIRLWLKNGSEFVGGWDKPSVHVALDVGGAQVSVDVPIEKLKRLRFRGEPVWPDKPIYRVRTNAGDDFFVDASASKINFQGELGSFSPFLSEIARLERLDPEENTWQIQLKNGTTLHAGIEKEGCELHPAMGPEKVELSWSLIARMEPAVMSAPIAHPGKSMPVSPAVAEQVVMPDEAVKADSYYSNDSQRRVKASMNH